MHSNAAFAAIRIYSDPLVDMLCAGVLVDIVSVDQKRSLIFLTIVREREDVRVTSRTNHVKGPIARICGTFIYSKAA